MLPQRQLYLNIKQGSSQSARYWYSRSVVSAIEEWCVRNDCAEGGENKKKYLKCLLSYCDRTDAETFLEATEELGYTTQKTLKLTALYWNAMAEEANLRNQQQMVVKAYLANHFGKQIVDTNRAICEVGENYVPYSTLTENINGEKIQFAF